MNQKRCKKCQRPLPDGYKYKYCENCRNKQVDDVKTGIKAFVGGIVLAAVPIIAKVTKGRNQND